MNVAGCVVEVEEFGFSEICVNSDDSFEKSVVFEDSADFIVSSADVREVDNTVRSNYSENAKKVAKKTHFSGEQTQTPFVENCLNSITKLLTTHSMSLIV